MQFCLVTQKVQVISVLFLNNLDNFVRHCECDPLMRSSTKKNLTIEMMMIMMNDFELALSNSQCRSKCGAQVAAARL